MIELRIALQEKQKQFRRSIEKNYCTAFGGARGGGKSYALRNIFLLRRFEFPGSVGVIFRKTFPELLANHIQPMLKEHPGLRPYWNESKKVLSLPNGSILQFAHCANDKDVALHQGKEWHDFGFDEAGQISENMFRTLQGSNRSSVPHIPARTAISLNPGGAGHQWVKRLFIEKRYNERERPQDYSFIQSLIHDNDALISSDPDYLHRLNAEPNEALRRAYLYGDWDLLAGMFFTELRREVHLINPFEIPKHWLRFGCLDHGFNHPAAFGWFACDEDGNVFQYREQVVSKKRIDENAEMINSFEDTEKLQYIVAGHDCWQDRGVTLKTGAPNIAEEYANHGIYLSRGNIGRIQGATQVRNYLAFQEEARVVTQPPRFRMFTTCPLTYDCLSRMEHDPARAEDVLKVDAANGDPNTGDDPYDMVRMALMSRPPLTERPRPRLQHGSEAWGKQEAKEMEEMLLGQHRMAKEIESGLRASKDPWSDSPGSFGDDW